MSKQADKAIIEALMWAGTRVSIQENFIEANKHELKPFHFDATHCPDLFPPLVALAAHCIGESRILGVSRLRVKESDRAKTLQQEFKKLGIKIEVEGELMRVFWWYSEWWHSNLAWRSSHCNGLCCCCASSRWRCNN